MLIVRQQQQQPQQPLETSNNNRVDQHSLSDRNRRRQAAYEMKISEKNYQQEKQTTCGDVNFSQMYI